MSLSSDFHNVETGKDLGDGQNLTGPENLQLAKFYVELSRLIDAWPIVPAQVRAEILATIESHVDTHIDTAMRVARIPSTERIPKGCSGVARPKTT